MNRDINLMLAGNTHIVAIDEHNCRFGWGHRPTCLDCHYVGPVVSPHRAEAISREHTAKMLGTWKAAR